MADRRPDEEQPETRALDDAEVDEVSGGAFPSAVNTVILTEVTGVEKSS